MTYRDPAPVQCETCMNKKTRSPKMPMSKANKKTLSIISFGAVVGIVLSVIALVIDFFGQHTVPAPFSGYESGLAASVAFSVPVVMSILVASIHRGID